MEKVKYAKKIIMIVWIAFFVIFGVCLACTTVVPEYYAKQGMAIEAEENYKYNSLGSSYCHSCEAYLSTRTYSSSLGQYIYPGKSEEYFDEWVKELDDLIESRGTDTSIPYENKNFDTANIHYFEDLRFEFDSRIKNEKQQAKAFINKSNTIKKAMWIPAWITGVIFGLLTIAFIVLTILSKKGNKQQL